MDASRDSVGVHYLSGYTRLHVINKDCKQDVFDKLLVLVKMGNLEAIGDFETIGHFNV